MYLLVFIIRMLTQNFNSQYHWNIYSSRYKSARFIKVFYCFFKFKFLRKQLFYFLPIQVRSIRLYISSLRNVLNIIMIWWRCPADFYKKNLLEFDPRTSSNKSILGSNWRKTTFLAIGTILFDSLCTQGSQKLKNENCNLWNPGCNLVSNLSAEIDKLKNTSWKRAGRDPGSAVSPYICAIFII